MSDLPKQLRIKAGMISMGERIAWGSDSALMEQAADLIEQQQSRIVELENNHRSLKDGVTLTPCYECGTPVHELSPRSRCCKCEYNRANFNEKENNQLREQLG